MHTPLHGGDRRFSVHANEELTSMPLDSRRWPARNLFVPDCNAVDERFGESSQPRAENEADAGFDIDFFSNRVYRDIETHTVASWMDL